MFTKKIGLLNGKTMDINLILERIRLTELIFHDSNINVRPDKNQKTVKQASDESSDNHKTGKWADKKTKTVMQMS